jgi:hypothetical protein
MNTNQASYDARMSALVVSRNPVPFEVTEANAENITVRPFKAGVNPLYDAAQRTFERKDKGNPPTYQNAVRALANRIAEKHVRQARMRCEHLRAELVVESASAIGEFIAVRVSRFPLLAQDLLARFACGALPSSTARALHRCARRACDARMARMGGRSQLVEPSFFNIFTDESADRCAELDAVFVNSRIDYLLGLVRARGATSGNANRAAQAHAKLLEEARAYFLASIAGEAVNLPAHGLNPVSVPVGFNVVETKIHDGKREKLVASEGYLVTEGKGQRLSASALWMRIDRLASFTGSRDIRDALGRGRRG